MPPNLVGRLDCLPIWPLGGDTRQPWSLPGPYAFRLSTGNFIKSVWTSPSKPCWAISHTTTHPARAAPPPRTCTPFEHLFQVAVDLNNYQTASPPGLELSTTVVSFPFIKRFVHVYRAPTHTHRWEIDEYEETGKSGWSWWCEQERINCLLLQLTSSVIDTVVTL